MRNKRYGERGIGESRDRERDAVNCDRALLDAVAQYIGGRLDPDAPSGRFGLDGANSADRVHMALHVVAAERVADTQRRLDIHLGAEGLRASKGLGNDVEGQGTIVDAHHGQAHAVDGDRVADVSLYRSLDDEPTAAEGRDVRPLPNDAGEHGSKATLEDLAPFAENWIVKMSEPAPSSLDRDFSAVLRGRLDLAEVQNESPISPELVLVDPELRSRLAELPVGPIIAVPVRPERMEPRQGATEESGGKSLLASVAYICALVLALPVLAMAADLVRSDRPHLVPQQLPASGRVHVGLEQHVRSHPPLAKPREIDRPG